MGGYVPLCDLWVGLGLGVMIGLSFKVEAIYQNLARPIKEGIDVTAKEASTDTWDTCHVSKQARLGFAPSSNKTTETLELIRMGLCGPLPTESLGGKECILG